MAKRGFFNIINRMKRYYVYILVNRRNGTLYDNKREANKEVEQEMEDTVDRRRES
jgi:hypothetical protein